MFDFLNSGEDQEKRRELEENIAQIRKKVQQEERQRRAEEGGDFRETPQEPQPVPTEADRMQEDAGPGDDWEPEPPGRPSEGPSQEQGSQEPSRRRNMEQQAKEQSNTQEMPPQPPERRDQGENRSAANQPQAREQTGSRAQDAVGGQQTDRSSQKREETESAASPQRSGNPFEPGRGQDTPEPESSGSGSQEPGARLSREDVPQAPEVKDLDIPDIEKGPLFITVNKFKDALTTLSEMKHLVSDMESDVGSLENTLEEDRETEGDMRNILNKTIADAEIIQNIVSPSKD